MGFTGFYWVFTGFYWVLLGSCVRTRSRYREIQGKQPIRLGQATGHAPPPPPTPRHRLTQNKEHGSNTKPGNNSVKTGPTRNKWVRSTTQEDDGERKTKPKQNQKKNKPKEQEEQEPPLRFHRKFRQRRRRRNDKIPPKKNKKKQKNVANSAPISIRSASNVLASSWYQTQ